MQNTSIQQAVYGVFFTMTVYEQVQQSIDYIENRLTESLRAGEVAARANMSFRSFCNYFRPITGRTYKEYVTRRRLARALPEEGDASAGNFFENVGRRTAEYSDVEKNPVS